MKRSDREKKAAGSDEDYPFGLQISLDGDSLKKLGINDMPKPGDKFHIQGEAHVTSSAQRDTDQNSDRRVGLVLHELGAEAKRDNSAAKPEKSIREDLEDARHQARGTTTTSAGRIGARGTGNGSTMRTS